MWITTKWVGGELFAGTLGFPALRYSSLSCVTRQGGHNFGHPSYQDQCWSLEQVHVPYSRCSCGLSGVLTSKGSKESLSVPCTFRHFENNVNIVMHVEDIFAVENEVVLQLATEQLKKQDDLKNKTIGPKEH